MSQCALIDKVDVFLLLVLVLVVDSHEMVGEVIANEKRGGNNEQIDELLIELQELRQEAQDKGKLLYTWGNPMLIRSQLA